METSLEDWLPEVVETSTGESNDGFIQDANTAKIRVSAETPPIGYALASGGPLITGRGNRTRPTCGEIIFAYREEIEKNVFGDEVKYVRDCCHQQGCPYCSWAWVSRQGEKAARYLSLFAERVKTKFQHWVLGGKKSETWDRKKLTTILKKLYTNFARNKKLAYLTVCHPYSADEATTTMKKYWHLHVVSNAYLNTRDKRWKPFLKKHKVSFTNVTNKNAGAPFGDYATLYSVISYELRKALFIPRHHTITYYGAIRRFKLRCNESEELVLSKAKHPFARVRWENIDDTPKATSEYSLHPFQQTRIYLTAIIREYLILPVTKRINPPIPPPIENSPLYWGMDGRVKTRPKEQKTLDSLIESISVA